MGWEITTTFGEEGRDVRRSEMRAKSRFREDFGVAKAGGVPSL
jgi:hypothetical protein